MLDGVIKEGVLNKLMNCMLNFEVNGTIKAAEKSRDMTFYSMSLGRGVFDKA